MERTELADHDQRVPGRGYHHTNGRSVVDEKTNAPDASLRTAKHRGCCSGCRWCAPEAEDGSNSRRERHQSQLVLDPDMEEASDPLSYILLIDNGFLVRLGRRPRSPQAIHPRRRRRFLSAKSPA